MISKLNLEGRMHPSLPEPSLALARRDRAEWSCPGAGQGEGRRRRGIDPQRATWSLWRSEEHTSELQSQSNLVCRLLLEKKKKKKKASKKIRTKIEQEQT